MKYHLNLEHLGVASLRILLVSAAGSNKFGCCRNRCYHFINRDLRRGVVSLIEALHERFSVT